MILKITFKNSSYIVFDDSSYEWHKNLQKNIENSKWFIIAAIDSNECTIINLADVLMIQQQELLSEEKELKCS